MTKPKQPTSKQDRQWAEAKRRCRLNREDIRIARELGLKPRSLIKNIPSPQQQWKLPVKQWLHELYKKKTGKTPEKWKKWCCSVFDLLETFLMPPTQALENSQTLPYDAPVLIFNPIVTRISTKRTTTS